MKSVLLSIFILIANFQPCNGQIVKNNDASNREKGNTERVKNSLYLSTGGVAIAFYSLNYERRIGDKLWGRAGFSYAPILQSKSASIPLGLTYLVGEKANFLELGLGSTFLYYKDAEEFDFFDDSDNKNSRVVLTGTIGYRYQPVEDNLFFAIAFTPVYSPSNAAIRPFGGLSIGYSY